MKNPKASRTIFKTGGDGVEYEIPNPDFYLENGHFCKIRRCNNAKRKKKRK